MRGDKGDRGEAGQRGEPGSEGPKGERGFNGDKGGKGAPGTEMKDFVSRGDPGNNVFILWGLPHKYACQCRNFILEISRLRLSESVASNLSCSSKYSSLSWLENDS